MAKGFELTFWGSPGIRFRRRHATYEAAVAEANRLHGRLAEDGTDAGRFRAIVHGPDLGRDGRTVW